MATLTLADLANRVLENIGVKSATEDPIAADAELVKERITSLHVRLRALGKAQYPTSAFPEWAQDLITDLVSAKVVNVFGVQGQRLQAILSAAAAAQRDLDTHASSKQKPIPIRQDYF